MKLPAGIARVAGLAAVGFECSVATLAGSAKSPALPVC
ncbi:hypothetical protein METH_10520 [Leisingera methylohalidivorans DSM 14336]|uniref:Uncharacterized protein n=1 Tax=Leisingera methylohalidivorans DSM 14336 TaxID=999552 RepID=V9VWB9_9RHOB|nr:hypothetical protein METH_10520 [Leisingera methylohalidivorans DSM 14336]